VRLRDALWLCGVGLVAGGCDPNNEDPLVLTINGEPIGSIFGLRYLREPLLTEVGDTLEIEFDVKDPDNDPTFIWWAGQPPGWDFPPEAKRGTWTVPDDYWVEWLELFPLVTDDRDPAGTDMVWMAIYVEGAVVPVEDTGDTGSQGVGGAGLLQPWTGVKDTGDTGDSGDSGG